MTGSTAFEKTINAITQSGIKLNSLKQRVTDEHFRLLIQSNLNENQIKLIERFPINSEKFVDSVLIKLLNENIISDISYPKGNFDTYFLLLKEQYIHADKVTYIYPEEARLIFALTYILKPERCAFIGCFYGYWAIWSILAMKELNRGKAVLIDLDKKCCELANKNIKNFNLSEYCKIANEDAIEFFKNKTEKFDWLVLDAEGPKQHHDYDLSDKALYYPLTKACIDNLISGGLLICHNILLSHKNNDPYFSNIIINNARQFYKFQPLVNDVFEKNVIVNSTEGIGIYQKL